MSGWRCEARDRVGERVVAAADFELILESNAGSRCEALETARRSRKERRICSSASRSLDGKADVIRSVVEEVVGDLHGKRVGKHTEAAANDGLGVCAERGPGEAYARLISNLLEVLEGRAKVCFDEIAVGNCCGGRKGAKVASELREAVGSADRVRVVLKPHSVVEGEVGGQLPLILDV